MKHFDPHELSLKDYVKEMHNFLYREEKARSKRLDKLVAHILWAGVLVSILHPLLEEVALLILYLAQVGYASYANLNFLFWKMHANRYNWCSIKSQVSLNSQPPCFFWLWPLFPPLCSNVTN